VPQFAALAGEPVFGARRVIGVTDAREYPAVDQVVQALGQDVAGDAEPSLEVVEASHAEEGRIPRPPIAALLGMGISDIQPGRVTFSLDVGEHLYNPIGSVHGGIFCTLLDSAMGCAVYSTLGRGQAYATLEIAHGEIRLQNVAGR
jgi:uncharacterized protein DUF4442